MSTPHLNRAQRRQLARVQGHRGTKAKRRKPIIPPGQFVTPDGRVLTREQVETTIEAAKSLQARGFVFADQGSLLWTPGQR